MDCSLCHVFHFVAIGLCGHMLDKVDLWQKQYGFREFSTSCVMVVNKLKLSSCEVYLQISKMLIYIYIYVSFEDV